MLYRIEIRICFVQVLGRHNRRRSQTTEASMIQHNSAAGFWVLCTTVPWAAGPDCGIQQECPAPTRQPQKEFICLSNRNYGKKLLGLLPSTFCRSSVWVGHAAAVAPNPWHKLWRQSMSVWICGRAHTIAVETCSRPYASEHKTVPSGRVVLKMVAATYD